MGTVCFAFKPGDTVYVERQQRDGSILASAQVATFWKANNANYYRLQDGKAYEESELLSQNEYELSVELASERHREYLEKALARL